jgi:hypothetical protein
MERLNIVVISKLLEDAMNDIELQKWQKIHVKTAANAKKFGDRFVVPAAIKLPREKQN